MEMTIEEYARELERGDWTAPMSDYSRTWASFSEWEDRVKKEAITHPAKMRLWVLAYGFEAKFTWWVADDDPEREAKIAARYEAGWRWYGCVAWARGWKDITPEEAKALCKPEGKDVGRLIDWAGFDALIEENAFRYLDTLCLPEDVDAARAVDRDIANR